MIVGPPRQRAQRGSSARRVARAGTVVLLSAALSGCLLVGYDPSAQGFSLDAATENPGTALEAGIDAAPRSAPDAADVMARDADSSSDVPDSARADAAGDASAKDGALSDASDAARASDAGPTCDAALNACGGCSALAHAPASACGSCGLGSYTCVGTDAVACTGGSAQPASSGGTVLIDDFEDGDSKVNPIDGLSGTWYTLSDGTSGTIAPAVGSTLVPVSGGALGSARAMHVSGRGFTFWGAGLAASLSAYQCKYDGSAQRGLQFYAKGSGALQVALATSQTVRASQGGSCTANCDDHFNVPVALSSGWQLHTITFSSLKQSGFGTPATFQVSQLMYVQFYFGPNVTFDLAVDNVAFD
ncbi:MAG: hypothetical protein JWN04_6270 [Myxococcaceae bacterium]|nr:hypothetical protein [Myxococcaceae bacterium]